MPPESLLYLNPHTGKKISLLLLFICFLIGQIHGQQTEHVTPEGTKFFLYKPPGYNPIGNPYPLLVSLHGLGSVGDNLQDLVTEKDQIPAKIIYENRWPSNYPFIVVTPQLKPGVTYPDQERPGWPPDLINRLIDFVLTQNNVDPNKIYMTGLSMGARGTWNYAAAFPNRIAAMIPISGITDTTEACSVKNIPSWVFHGSNDNVVEPSYSIDMVNAIQGCLPKADYIPHLTLLHAQRHEGWSNVYDNSSGYNIYDWLLQFSRNDRSNKFPYVNAGADLKILNRDQPLHLYGDYFDSDGTITQVQWTKKSGPSITLEGTTTRFLKLSNLTPGVFEFELSATDNNGSRNADKIIVEILSGIPSEPVINDLILVNGSNESDIGKLDDGYRINTDAIGTNKINIRVSSQAESSVRFRINGNHNLWTRNTPGPYLMDEAWRSEEGEYQICATPLSERNGNGTAGVSQCFKITISKREANPTTGLDENFNKIELYPNPAAVSIHLKGSKISGHTQYSILNSIGTEIQHEEIAYVSMHEGLDINLLNYPPGIYILILRSNHMRHFVKFVIE